MRCRRGPSETEAGLRGIGIDETVYASLGDANQIGQGNRCIIERQCERCAVKISSGENFTCLRKDQRIVSCASSFNFHNFSSVIQGSANCPVHLRHAAQTVGVLHPRIVFQMRISNLAAFEQLTQMSLRLLLVQHVVWPRESVHRKRPSSF